MLRLTANDGAFTSADDVTITVNPAPVNQPPVVNAGTDQTITLPGGRGARRHGDRRWVADASGRGDHDVVDVQRPGHGDLRKCERGGHQRQLLRDGTYVLRLTANDGAFSPADDITITVNPAPANQPPVVNAGNDQTITLPASAALDATVTDDGLPDASGRGDHDVVDVQRTGHGDLRKCERGGYQRQLLREWHLRVAADG